MSENNDKMLVKKEGFLYKVKKFFSNFFNSFKEKNNYSENLQNEIEIQVTKDSFENDVVESSTSTVNKGKLEEIRLGLDSGSKGYEDVYQLSLEEMEALDGDYDGQIDKNVSKLEEVYNQLVIAKRRLSKIQSQNSNEEQDFRE